MSDERTEVVERRDNVATLLRDVESGETVEVDVGDGGRTITVSEDVEFGHKIAVEEIEEGGTVYKYGKSIGDATGDIEPGDWVHVHNVESNYGRGDLADGDGGEEAAH